MRMTFGLKEILPKAPNFSHLGADRHRNLRDESNLGILESLDAQSYEPGLKEGPGGD